MGRIRRPKLVRRARTIKPCPSPIGLEPLEPRRLFSAALTNGSFEDGLNGFTVLGGSAYVVDAAGGVTDGTNALRFNNSSDISDAVIAQTIATEVGQRYEVTFDYGTFGSATRQSQELRFEALGGGGLITTQDYSVVNGAGFVTHTFGFVATNDFTELRISDVTTEANASGLDGVLDNLRIAETLFLEPEINNPGFEGQLTGYTVESGSAFEFRGGTVSEGGLALRLNSSNGDPDLVLRQTLNTEVGTTYRIGFDLGIFGATNRTHEIRFEAIAGGEVLSSADYQKTGQDFTGQTFTFTATATTTDLRFSDLTTVSNGISSDLVLDNLSIDVLNRAPVAIAFSGADVDEGVAAGTRLGQFTTTDVDAGDTQTYTLISGDTDLLQIVGDELFTRETFDFDVQPTLTFVVRSTDSQGATLDRTFTLQVNPNSAPVEIAFSGSEVDENVDAGTLLGQFTTTDPDPGDTHTYTLVSGDTDLLQIVGDELFTRDTFTFDTHPTLTAVVRSTDSQGATLDRTFTVQVNEVISPFFTVGLNPATFNASPSSLTFTNQIDPFGSVVDDADPSVRVDLTAPAAGGDAAEPARVVSITMPAAGPVQALVQRLAKAATDFLPLFSLGEAASASDSATAAAAEPAEPGALPQVQPPEITVAPAAYNPWLAGVIPSNDGGNTSDPVTAWLAWLDVLLSRDSDGSPPPFAATASQVTEVPTGP